MTPALPARRLVPDDVARAAEVVRAHLALTPLRPSLAAGREDVLLKLECWQPTGSFKVRGALHTLSALTAAERARGVVAASAGNHALGVAFAARALGLARATLFVPESAPEPKRRRLQALGAETVVRGATYDEACGYAAEHAERTGATPVHAYEDPRTAAGQGTVGLEVLDALPEPGTLVVPVGGGGLLAGVATAVKARHPRARVVAVQPEASPALRDSLRVGRPLLAYEAGPTLADGLAGGIGEMAWLHRDLVDEVLVVPEPDIEGAIVALAAEDQLVAEASGAITVAAVRSGLLASAPGPVVCIVTGANLDARVLGRLLAQRLP